MGAINGGGRVAMVERMEGGIYGERDKSKTNESEKETWKNMEILKKYFLVTDSS